MPKKKGLSIFLCLLAFVAQPSTAAPHQFYRLVIDSVGFNTDGYSSVNEIQLLINGIWLENSNTTIGNNTTGSVRFGPVNGTSYNATVSLTDECCGRDLSMLFNGDDDVSWVAGYPYKAFELGAQGDSLVPDSIWAVFDFGAAPVSLQGMRIFGDPWPGYAPPSPGAEAPDRFRIQYSDDGVNFNNLYETDTDVDTILGFDAVWSPEYLLNLLASTVVQMNIHNGISNALDNKLDAALNALDDTNANNDGAALNSMYAFCNSVNAQRDKKLTGAQADELLADANLVIASLDVSASPCQ